MSDSVFSDSQVRDFARDGVLYVPGVFGSDEVALAVRAVDTVLAQPGPLAQVASGLNDPGSFFEDFRRWQDIPEIEALANTRHCRRWRRSYCARSRSASFMTTL